MRQQGTRSAPWACIVRPHSGQVTGSRQDWQRFYEDPAVDEMVRHMAFHRSAAVLEFGCGTGRLAERLLRREMPPSARYHGVDLSDTMVGLTRRRLAPFGERATVERTDGAPQIPAATGSWDRVISVYVLDLLSAADTRALLEEAWRALEPGGLLGLVSLTHGATAPARAVEWLWTSVYRFQPSWVGGCRPISLEAFLGSAWTVRHRAMVTSWAITSEVIVAERPAS